MRFVLQRFLWIVVITSGLALSPAAQSQQSAAVRIWADKTTDVSGRVSRDGRVLPFVDWTTYGLSVRDMTSGDVRTLVLHDDIWLIGLTADGSAHFAGYGAPFVTYVARVTWPAGDVSQPTAIPTPRFLGARRPVFSPDGRRLATVFRAAYPGVRPGWQTPTVTELAAGPQWTFPSHLTIRDEVAWLPDGQSLIAINDEPGAGEGAGPPWTFWRLSTVDRSVTRAGRARDSGLVRLAGITEREIVYKRNVFSPLVSYIEAVDIQTGSTRELYRTSEEITDASLSPDGKQLAIAVRRANLTDVYLLRVGEPTPSRLVLPDFRANARPQAMWLATQDALILTGVVGNEQGNGIVPLNGNAPQRLRLDVEGLIEARMSPDGGMVAYTNQPPSGRELWLLRNAVPAARARRAARELTRLDANIRH